MKRIISTFALTALLALLALSCFAQWDDAPGGVFKSVRGFSITYPKGWRLASQEQSAGVLEKARPYLKDLGNVDLSRLAVLIFAPKNANFNPNLNVVVVNGTLTPSETGKTKMREIALQVGERFGGKQTDLTVTTESFAGEQAIVTRYNIAFNGMQMNQMQVALPGKAQSYMVTCSCATSDAARLEPVFRRMIDSMQFEKADSRLPIIAQDALIGAVIGGLFGAAISLWKKRRL